MRSARTTPDWETLKLKRAMLDAGLTSRELAARIGTPLRCVQNLLSGCHRSWPLRAKLNRFFKASIFDPAFRRQRGRPLKRPTNPAPKNL